MKDTQEVGQIHRYWTPTLAAHMRVFHYYAVNQTYPLIHSISAVLLFRDNLNGMDDGGKDELFRLEWTLKHLSWRNRNGMEMKGKWKVY